MAKSQVFYPALDATPVENVHRLRAFNSCEDLLLFSRLGLLTTCINRALCPISGRRREWLDLISIHEAQLACSSRKYHGTVKHENVSLSHENHEILMFEECEVDNL